MLHKETVEPATLDLIRKLQADPELQGFQMAGGTALALMIGHRISVDIDLFSRNEFDAEALSVHPDKKYGFYPERPFPCIQKKYNRIRD